MTAGQNVELEQRVRDHFTDIAGRTTVSGGAVSPRRWTGPPARDGHRGRWAYVTAAAATIALVAGAVVVQGNRSGEPGTVPAPDDPVGIFPAGNVERVVAFGYVDPVAVATAYLADRFPATPSGDQAAVYVEPPQLLRGGDQALVWFDVDVGEGSAHRGGVLIAERAGGRGGANGWAVVSASMGADVSRLTYDDGALSGDIDSDGAGTRSVTIHDAATGDLLDAAELDRDHLEFDGLVAPAVTVRYWNPVDEGDEVGARDQFVEVLIRRGEQWSEGITGQLDELRATAIAGPFDDDPISGFRELSPGEHQEITDADGLRIAISAGPLDQPNEDSYCVEVNLGASGYSRCGTPADEAAHGIWIVQGPTRRAGERLIVSVVPDTVASVTDESGQRLPVVHNVWYDVVGPTRQTYLLESADGSVRQTLTFGAVLIGTEPALGRSP